MMIEMGETGALSKPAARLQAGGLGSCVGLCLYETALQIAVLVHIVLPQTLPCTPRSSQSSAVPLPGKCADTAIPHALTEIERLGGSKGQVQAAIVGGAQIFQKKSSSNVALSPHLEIGKRNVFAVKEALRREGIPIRAEDSGGQCGRTVTLDSSTGNVWVRQVGLSERLLVTLGQTNYATPFASQGAEVHGQ